MIQHTILLYIRLVAFLPRKKHIATIYARGYCTVTLPGNPIRQFVARLKAFRSHSPKALLPLSDFDRQEIALNAITSTVRFVGKETKTGKYAREGGDGSGEEEGGGGEERAGSVVSFQGG